MYLYKFYGVIFAMSCVLLIGLDAYPTINIRRFFDSAVEGIYKKSEIPFPQIDEDVLELEHLKRNPDDEMTDNTSPDSKQYHEHSFENQHETTDVEMPLAVGLEESDSINQSDTLPELERQLESVTTVTVTPTKQPVDAIVGQPEQEQDEGIQGGHRPPILQHNDGGKASNNNHQQVENPSGADVTAGVPSMAKPFYGAARLAFGQNPEVLPTSSTTSTSTMTSTTSSTSTTITSAPVPTSNKHEAVETVNAKHNPSVDATKMPEISTAKHPVLQPLRPSHLDEPKIVEIENTHEEIASNKETASDVILDGLEGIKTAERRSVPHLMPPKTAESLLKHDGQYSAFDMAQYVFWTGDEVGVARAVEEFIGQGLMTRENALKFLREIRTGIEYLQRSYSRRVFPEEILENNVKKSFPPLGTTTTTTSTTTTTTEKPLLDTHLDVGSVNQRNYLHLPKTIDSISMWNKLQEMNNDERQELTDYDESAGRAKIAEFLYKEYTLEEILYNLAKVMFAQSLSHGSGEAHHELQKLTDFLEREGNRGVIPLDLQKKVLHVLLTALSDTLSEHPELLPAARVNLGSSLNSLPMRNYGAFN